MKVLHINTSAKGGAALCAIRICKALEQQGIESRMLFAQGVDIPEDINGAIAEKDKIVHLRSNWLIAKFRHLLMRMPWYWNVEKMQARLKEDNITGLYVHHPLSEYSNIVNHPLVKWADIIHLHWVAEFVDYPTFFRNVNKPIVWTLHDEFPAVGVQHYCSNYSILPVPLQPIDNFCRKVKRKAMKHARKLNLVAISKCMEDVCAHSDILSRFPVNLIHNGIDGDTFRLISKTEARYELGLSLDTTIFMFSSFYLFDERKGLSLLIESLNRIGRDNMMLICVGNNTNASTLLPPTNYPIIQTGMIKDQNLLALYYSAADYFIQCSYEESFGQTPLEAMSCGTPVVAFPAGVIPELINDENGVVCHDFTVEALKEGIEMAMQRNYDGTKIREHLLSRFSYEKIAQQYIKLYKSIIK